MSALELMRRLEHGAPAVFADPSAVDRGRILFDPMSLKDGEPAQIAERVRGGSRARELSGERSDGRAGRRARRRS